MHVRSGGFWRIPHLIVFFHPLTPNRYVAAAAAPQSKLCHPPSLTRQNTYITWQYPSAVIHLDECSATLPQTFFPAFPPGNNWVVGNLFLALFRVWISDRCIRKK